MISQGRLAGLILPPQEKQSDGDINSEDQRLEAQICEQISLSTWLHRC